MGVLIEKNEAKIWLNIYDSLLKKKIPEETQLILKQHKTTIQKIYNSIEGEWWKTGSLWQKIYRLENWYGKASYELKKELKAINIVQKDITTVKALLKG